MKGIDIFCASQSSTAISHAMEQASSSSSSSNTFHLGGRALDRHNPIIMDSRRTPSRDFTLPPTPSSVDPKPGQHDLQKGKKKSSSSSSPPSSSSSSKRSSRKGHDKKKSVTENKVTEHFTNNHSSKAIDSVVRRSWVTPAGSSRYLLRDISDYDPVLALTTSNINVDDDKKKGHQVVHNQDETIKHHHASNSKPSSSSSAPKSASSNQVVVLRVSLHCKGCEGKVRKHLSRMQGVTSFNIDFAAKKVTVVGDVTPLSVLASISKVKNAQFWPPPPSGSASNPESIKRNLA
ncbi:hypothetical protein HN51_015698 [Arachis hypogaea]|uniref:HMA domain-containing protein n=1 Tax=Arachis hypogaea TaxID=3818 RepID=A0A445CJB4_ARAHY|nr:protein SODIUM POTASSIUM ROOT DEFECTIVE 2 [Arachis hypogaea]QHO46193.1 uncharacterized protein DS421_6g185270 [Arachis hypogaea]RYR51025.1 hypothetical protein Ahy_A06g026080 [Arachis hypogaea]